MVPLRPLLISFLVMGAGASYVEFGPGKEQLARIFDLQQHLSKCAEDQVNQTLEMIDQAQRGQTLNSPSLNCDPTQPLAGWDLPGNQTSPMSGQMQQQGGALEGGATPGMVDPAGPGLAAMVPNRQIGYPWQVVASLGVLVLILAGAVLFLALRLRSRSRPRAPPAIRIVRVVACPRCKVRIAAAERVRTCPVCALPGLPPPDSPSFARGAS